MPPQQSLSWPHWPLAEQRQMPASAESPEQVFELQSLGLVQREPTGLPLTQAIEQMTVTRTSPKANRRAKAPIAATA